MNNLLLRSFIREALLLEEVFGAQAIVYHGTKSDPDSVTNWILSDTFRAGKGSGMLYGPGLYCVYDLKKAAELPGGSINFSPSDDELLSRKDSPTHRGSYGLNILKLKVNLNGYIIFDEAIARKVYKENLSPVDQAKKLGLGKNIVNVLEKAKEKKQESGFTSDAALFASDFIKSKVKGLVFTGENDGHVVVVYDPSTAIPIAWKTAQREGAKRVIWSDWTPVDKKRIASSSSLRKSAGGEFEEEKYSSNDVKVLKSLENLPTDKRIVRFSIDITDQNVMSIPSGTKILGDLFAAYSSIINLPQNFEVQGLLDLRHTQIKKLPDGLKVGQDLMVSSCRNLESLPQRLKVRGNLYMQNDHTTIIPDDAEIGGKIYVSYSYNKKKIPPHLLSKIA